MFSKADIEQVASLSRIYLNDQEIARMTQELAQIIGYVEQLKKADVVAVEPTTHVLPIKNVYRPDTIKPSLPQAEALAMAPAKTQDSFKVPQVIE